MSPALAPTTAETGPAPELRDGLHPWDAQVGAVAVRYGAGRLAELGELAAGLLRGTEARRVLLVTDPGVAEAGHARRAQESLEAAGLETETFDRVTENPTTQVVEAGTEVARAFAPRLLIGLGGGSAMDTAKGINFLLTGGGAMEDYWGFDKATEPLLPSIGVPTTAGTGSEAQSFALISQASSHRKMACGAPGARFRAVILDPELLATAPDRTAALAGIDAVSHAVESFVTRKANPISSLLAREAWHLLAPHLAPALDGDTPALGSLLLGAHLAGAAIEASMLGAAHAAANPLTARFGVPHGAAVGLLLPAVVRWNGQHPSTAARYGELLAVTGEETSDPGETLAHHLETLLHPIAARAGLPRTLTEAGIPPEDHPDLAHRATQEWTGTFNPRPLTEKDFRALYASVS